MFSKMDQKFLFPYEKVRNIQNKLMEKVAYAIENRKNLVVHAPTGLGKTAAALSPALKYAIDKGLTVFFLTSRHTQHQIAIETLKDIQKKHKIDISIVDVIGKKWMCAQQGVENLRSNEFFEYCKNVREKNECEFYANAKENNKFTINAKKILDQIKHDCMHTEELVQLGKLNKLCPYELAIGLGSNARVVIADYAYIFNPSIRESFLQKTGKDLGKCIVIVDEGHNLPGRVRDLMSDKISLNMLKRAVSEAEKSKYDETAGLLKGLIAVLESYANECDKEKIVGKDDFVSRVVQDCGDYEQLIADFEFVSEEILARQKSSSIGGVARFLESWQGNDDGFARIFSKANAELAYKCLDPSLVSKEVINNAHSVIIMSGTLQPTFMFKDLLGFEDCIEEEFESPFDEENRLNLIVPQTTTKYSLRSEQQYRNIAKAVSEIIDAVPGNTIIFFPSYQIRDDVYKFVFEENENKFLKKELMLEHRGMLKEEKAKTLEKFKSFEKTGAAMFCASTGSFGEGIDLPGDLLKCVVVVGLPLEQPNLEAKELINYYQEKYERGWEYGYLLPAFTKCLQNAGRLIRSDKDKGVVVFLDERYIWPMYRRCFPEELNIVHTLAYKEMIRKFFTA